jgi:hypothetical protein
MLTELPQLLNHAVEEPEYYLDHSGSVFQKKQFHREVGLTALYESSDEALTL